MDHAGSGQAHTKYSYGLRHYIQHVGAWLKRLAPNNIHNFSQLEEVFVTNFMQLRKEGESISYYLKWFNKVTLPIPSQDHKPMAGAFMYGLLLGPLSWNFLGKKPTTRQELKERTQQLRNPTYMQQEQTMAKDKHTIFTKAPNTHQHKYTQTESTIQSIQMR
uniref:Retrotransposon gag domain-containing protein n=1 Tax=Lactuca sativa TaxID=4236 RepID=A0A9R1WJ24_LACSA|nr:hypothetical protein LSAT_V11C200055790 [Lactuca sativa]